MMGFRPCGKRCLARLFIAEACAEGLIILMARGAHEPPATLHALRMLMEEAVQGFGLLLFELYKIFD